MRALDILRTVAVVAEYKASDIKQWSADDIYAAVHQRAITIRLYGGHFLASACQSPRSVCVTRPNTQVRGALFILPTTTRTGIVVVYKHPDMVGVRRLARVEVSKTSTYRSAESALVDILSWHTRYGKISDILLADEAIPDMADVAPAMAPESVVQRRVRRPDLEHSSRTYDGIADEKGFDHNDFYQHHAREGYDFSGKAFRRPAHASTETR